MPNNEAAFAGSVLASDLVYTPINPTFGGNPLNASQLQAVASAQKPSAPTKASTSTQKSSSQQFLQMLQSQLYATLANSVSNAITGSNSQAAGTIKRDSMQVTWNTIDGEKHISMTD